MRYRSSYEKKHYLMKVVLAVLVAFFVYVGMTDVKPAVTHVEKIVPNAVNK